MATSFYKRSGDAYLLNKWRGFGLILIFAFIFIIGNLYLLLLHLTKQEGPFLFLFLFTLLPALAGYVLLLRKITINPASQTVVVTDLGFFSRKYAIADFTNFEMVRHFVVVVPIGYSVSFLFQVNGKRKTLEARRFRSKQAAQQFIAETAIWVNS